jgi:hypothetical protein
VKGVAESEVPTLVKYAEAVPYLIQTTDDFGKLRLGKPEGANRKSKIKNQKSDEWCELIAYDKEGEEKVLAAALYRFGDIPMAQALTRVQSLSEVERNNLVSALLEKLDQHDIPLRELEYCSYTFDLVMDQGAYAEFKRHRMMTQTPQKLTARLGYAVPRLMTDAGFTANYQAAMDAAAVTYEKLHAFNPQVAQYVVPNGYKRRVLAEFNLREAYAFCQLRSAPNAHFSIRRIANRIYEEIRRVHPRLASYMRLPAETWEDVQENYFTDC